jgi:hypothetical protein
MGQTVCCGMKETPRRRITVTSSLSEISTDPLGNWVLVKGGRVTQPAPTPSFTACFGTDVSRRRERLILHLGYLHQGWGPGLINCIVTKAKCRHLKKLPSKGNLRQVFIRDYRLDIQSVMFVFSTQICELMPL